MSSNKTTAPTWIEWWVGVDRALIAVALFVVLLKMMDVFAYSVPSDARFTRIDFSADVDHIRNNQECQYSCFQKGYDMGQERIGYDTCRCGFRDNIWADEIPIPREVEKKCNDDCWCGFRGEYWKNYPTILREAKAE